MTEEDKARAVAIQKANDAIFAAEELFPMGNSMRAQLYQARCTVHFQLHWLRQESENVE